VDGSTEEEDASQGQEAMAMQAGTMGEGIGKDKWNFLEINLQTLKICMCLVTSEQEREREVLDCARIYPSMI